MRESFVFLQGDANLTRVHHHVTGVLAHGQKKAYAFTWTDKFHPDTNITINCLLHVLEDVAEVSNIWLIFKSLIIRDIKNAHI